MNNAIPTPERDGSLRSWTQPLAAFRHRDFGILWAGTLVSNAGSWMQKVATGWLIYQMTGSSAWLGIDAFASGIPTVLLLPLGGVLSDRVSRRALLIWTNLLSAALALVLACLHAAHLLAVWHIVFVSAMSGVVQSVMVPASTSLLPALVGKDDVPNAIALNSIQFNLSRVLGPAFGGFTLVYWGATWSFALNALSFLVLVAAFVLIRQVPPLKANNVSIAQSMREAFTFVRHHSKLGNLLLLVFLTAFLGSPVVSLLPALVKGVFGREASSYSLLFSMFGAGAVAAAALIAVFDRGGWTRAVNLATLTALGITQAVLPFTVRFGFAAAVVAVAGALFVGTMVRLGTAILQTTPDELRGRVSAFQQLLFRAGQPVGALAAGVIGRQLGTRTVFCSFGAVLAAVMCVLFVRRHTTPERT